MRAHQCIVKKSNRISICVCYNTLNKHDLFVEKASLEYKSVKGFIGLRMRFQNITITIINYNYLQWDVLFEKGNALKIYHLSKVIIKILWFIHQKFNISEKREALRIYLQTIPLWKETHHSVDMAPKISCPPLTKVSFLLERLNIWCGPLAQLVSNMPRCNLECCYLILS